MSRKGDDTATSIAASEGGAPQRSRGRPPKEREPRRRKIIAAAADLFISDGYSQTTLEAVAKRARLSKRSIYELVGDKEQLFREVCHHSSTIDELNFSDAIDSGSLRNSLMALARRVIEHGLSDRIVGLERAIIMESRTFPHLIEDVVQANYLEANRRLAECLLHLQSLGLIRFDDVWHSCSLFFDMVVGQFVTRRVLGEAHCYPGDEYVALRVDLFIRCHPASPEAADAVGE